MSGNEEQLMQGILHPDTDGLVPRSAVYLFDRIAKRTRDDSRLKITVRASYCEIHNEQVRDLLNTENNNLPIRWNQEHGYQDSIYLLSVGLVSFFLACCLISSWCHAVFLS